MVQRILVIIAPMLLLGIGHLPAQDTTFSAQARSAWLATLEPGDSDSLLPARIAILAGLRFQKVSDRLTPDLDSALARSVMAGGTLRDTPWGWFALARQLQATMGTCQPLSSVSLTVWLHHCRRVLSAYRDALKRDSTFIPALVDLDELVPWPGLSADPDTAAYRLMAVATTPGLPEPLRVHFERLVVLLALEVEEPDALDSLFATSFFERFTPGERAFAESRRWALEGSGLAALEAYRRAATGSGPGEQLEWIRADLLLVGSKAELAAWDSLGVDGRSDWAQAFWEDRDFRDGHALGSEYLTYVGRRHVAYREYRRFYGDERLRHEGRLVAAMPGCPEQAATLSAVQINADMSAVYADDFLGCAYARPVLDERVFDDRGRTFIRHGEPQQRANYPGLSHYVFESWAYRMANGFKVIHFGRSRPLQLMGMAASPMTAGDWMSACQVTPRYCVLQARLDLGERIPPERMRQVVERGAEEMEQILTTDGDPQRFGDALPINAAAYGLGATPSRLTLAVDLPLSTLRKLSTDSTNAITLRWQLRIRNAAGAWAFSQDTVQHLVLPPPTDGDKQRYLTLTREVALAAGSYDLRAVLSDSADRLGTMYSRDDIPIIARAGVPDISDLVLLPDGGEGATRYIEGHMVRLSPTFTPGKASFVRVGYVLSDLAGLVVPIAVSVEQPRKDTMATLVSVAFVARPAGPREFHEQRIGLESLGKGAYDLVVRATMPGGQIRERRQRILVR